ncbi:MAG: HEAT repeat domain-containing protein [Cyanobacteria bacterium J06635_1]
MITPHLNLRRLAFKLSQKLTITLSLITLASPQLALASFRYPPKDTQAYPPFDALCTDEEIRALAGELENPEQDEFVFNALTACGREAAPTLARWVQLSSPERQTQALEALINLGSEAKVIIPVLEAELSRPDNTIRTRIPYALAKIGGADVLSNLLSALGHPDTRVKARAISALGLLGADAQPAVPALREALRDPELQQEAADTLGDIGPGAQAAIPDLIERLPGDSFVSSTAASSLSQIGTAAVPPLIQALQHPTAAIRIGAADALRRFGPAAAAATPHLIEALRDPALRFYAVDALTGIGPAAASASAPLVDLLADEAVGHLVVDALASIGAATVPDLGAVLKTSDLTVQLRATQVLGRIGPEAAEAIPSLVSLMGASEGELRHEVVRALSNIGKPAVPALIKALEDPAGRILAAIALGNIGPEAEAAIPALQEIFAEPTVAEPAPSPSEPVRPDPIIRPRLPIDPIPPIRPGIDLPTIDPTLVTPTLSPEESTRLSMALALGKIGPDTETPGIEKIVPPLLTLLNNPDVVIQTEAAFSLGNLGTLAAPAIHDLIEMMGTPGLDIRAFDARDTAAETLIKLGSPAVPDLITALAATDDTVYSRAAYALGEIGEPAITELAETLIHPDANVRRRAAFALGKVGQPAVPALLAALQSDTPAVRKAAAYGLGIAEISNREVITALQHIVDDESTDLDLRRTAASSLELLGIDQSSFFLAFNLLGPQLSVCPRLGFESYEFDGFTGDCLVTHEELIALAGIGDILTRLCQLFGC